VFRWEFVARERVRPLFQRAGRRAIARHVMQYWRLLVLAALAGTPVLILVGFGMYHLWAAGLNIWIWWLLAGCLALASLLGWHWQRRQHLLHVDFTPPLHWTDRDREAWRLVEARAKQLAQFPADKLTALAFFQET